MPFGRRRATSSQARIPWQEDAVDARLANAPRDQLAVLAPEIEHDDGVEVAVGACARPSVGSIVGSSATFIHAPEIAWRTRQRDSQSAQTAGAC